MSSYTLEINQKRNFLNILGFANGKENLAGGSAAFLPAVFVCGLRRTVKGGSLHKLLPESASQYGRTVACMAHFNYLYIRGFRC